ncbi:MAG: pyridoxal phosphate-dependent aminotransferase [Rhodomicrobiaceae bacterium]
MSARPPFTPLIDSLPATVPFVGPETHERKIGHPFRARIGANESVFGPSPAAIRAMQDAAPDVWKYGDPENHDLQAALAEFHGVPFECITVGEGVDAMLGNLVRLVVVEGTPVVTSHGAYPTFNYHVAGFGGKFEFVPYVEDREHPDGLIARAKETRSPLIYFANPDNPMGSWHDAGTVQRLMESVPEGAILCLDEAYIELAPEGTAPPLDVSNPRVIRFRTFSKAHGMAGARVGYGIAHPEIAGAFNKIRNHFGVNRIAQAGAMAALKDQAYIAQVQHWVGEARDRIGQIAEANGLKPLPSATNFVAVDCGRDGAFATRVKDELVARGIFVRMPFVAPQNRCIRISAGKPEHLDALAETLPEALRAADSVAA